MHARLLYLTILVAITALALVACGGDDGTAKAPRQSVSIRSMPTKAPTVPPPTVPPAPTPTASGTVIRVINHDTAGSGKYAISAVTPSTCWTCPWLTGSSTPTFIWQGN